MRKKKKMMISFVKITLLFLTVHLSSFISLAQCNASGFTVNSVNSACVSNGSITVQIPGASTCSNWNAKIVNSSGVSTIIGVPANGGPVVFGSLPANSYTVSLENTVSGAVVPYGSNPVVITSSYVPVSFNGVFTAPNCPNSAPGYTNNGQLVVNKNATGGLAPFTYTCVGPVSGTQTVNTSLNTATFTGLAQGEAVTVTVTDACGASVVQNLVCPTSNRSPFLFGQIYLQRACAPTCNSGWTTAIVVQNILTSGALADLQIPGNATISVNGGAPQNLTVLNASGAAIRFSGPLLSPGDTYEISVTDGCYVLTNSQIAPAINDANFVATINGSQLPPPGCEESYTLSVRARIFNNSAPNYVKYFCATNSITIEQEVPVGSGNWVNVPLVPLSGYTATNPLSTEITGASSTVPQAVYQLPGEGSYRVTAQDACHTIVRLVSTAGVNDNLSTIVISEQNGVASGTSSIEIQPLQYGLLPYVWPLTMTVTPVPFTSNIITTSAEPFATPTSCSITFPVSSTLNQTSFNYSTESLTMGDLPLGTYNVNITDGCGNERNSPITISRNPDYNQVLQVISGCSNSNRIRYTSGANANVLTTTSINNGVPAYMRLWRQNPTTGVWAQYHPGPLSGSGNMPSPYTWNNLPSGNYEIRFQGIYNTSGKTVSLCDGTPGRNYVLPVVVPDYVDIAITSSSLLCDVANPNSGLVAATIASGTPVYPLTFNLYAVGNPVPVQTVTYPLSSAPISSHLFTNVPMGDYVVEATSSCQTTTNNISVTAAPTPQITALEDTLCPGGGNVLLNSNVSPLLYSVGWSDNFGNSYPNGVTLNTSISVSTVFTATYTKLPSLGCPPSAPLSAVFTVAIGDLVAPIITCASDTTLYVAAGECTVLLPILAAPITSDNCSIASLTNNAPSNFPLGLTTVTWTITDGSGNTATCTQDVTILDTISPTITCPASLTASTAVPVDVASCFATGVALGTPLTADNCSAITVTNNAPLSFPLGTTTVIWTIEDGSGNTETCEQTVDVLDHINPTIICPNDTILYVGLGSCDVTGVVWNNVVVEDNCSIASLINNAPAIFPVGITTVAWTVTDGSGNLGTCYQQVEVLDTLKPVFDGILPQDTTLNCDALPPSVLLSATDNCGVQVFLTENIIPGTCGNSYILERTWTAYDLSYNQTIYLQTITVQDTTNPVFTLVDLPQDTIINCSELIPIAPVLSATDNCDGIGSLVLSEGQDAILNSYISGNVFFTGASLDSIMHTQLGNQLEFESYITPNGQNLAASAIQLDVFDNLVDASVTFEVETDMVPTNTGDGNYFIAIIDNSTMSALSVTDYTSTNPILVNPISAMNLVIVPYNLTTNSVVWSGSLLPGSYTALIMFNADIYGFNNGDPQPVKNRVTITADYFSVSPEIVTTYSEASTQGAPGTCAASNYVITRTWNAEDDCGNSEIHVQTITVQDTTNPVFDISTLPNDTTVNCDAVPAAITGSLSATDNCSVATDIVFAVTETSTEGAAGSCAASNYVITRTYSAEDVCGNIETYVQTITVQDTTNPVFDVATLPNDTTVNCDAVPAAVTASLSATDNCSVATNIVFAVTETSTEGPVGTCAASNYVITRTYLAEDVCGNSETYVQIITVQDTTNPVFDVATLPSDTTVNCDAVPAAVTASLSAIDNCSVATDIVFAVTETSTEGAAGTCAASNYVITRTYSAVDLCGNSETYVQLITVQDTVVPVLVGCPSDIAQNNDQDVCGAIVTWTLPTATDNCSSAVTIESSHQPNTLFPVGTTTVEYTATDACGNESSCSFDVVITDVQKPNVTVVIAENFCADEQVTWQQIVSDNCAVSEVELTHEPTFDFPEGDTEVSITVTDIHGNDSTYTFTVTVVPMPVAEINSSATTVCLSSEFILTASNASSNNTYTWYFNGTALGTGINYVSSSSTASSAGDYVLEVTNEYGCVSLDTFNIQVKACDIIIYEAFSPGKDKQNDYFYIENLIGFPNTKVIIYNRWGTEVYQSDDYQNDWDGTSQSKYNVGGDVLPEGTYFYLLELGGVEGDPMFGKIYKGYVYLKR